MTTDAGPTDSGVRAPHMLRLEGTSIPELLWQLHQAGHSGTLLLESAGVRKALYFRDGRIIFAASTDPEDRLGSLLFRRAEVDLAPLVDAGAEVVRGRRLGQVLVQRGLIEPGALVRAVIDQVREIVLSVFTWSEGRHRVSRAGLPGHETVTLDMPMEDLILAGVRQIQDSARVRRAVGGPRAVYQAIPDAWNCAAALGMTERAILDQLQQPRRVESLAASVIAPSEVVFRVVWGLLIIGLITRVPARSAVTSRAPEDSVREGFLDPEEGAPGLLLELGDRRLTGAVRLFRGLHQATVYFRDGRVDFATTTDPELGLGPHLLRRGVISDQDLDEAARRLITGRRLGVLLAERGALEFQEVGRFVRDQVFEIVKHVALWTEGEYEVEAGRTLDESIVLDRTVEDVVVAAYESLDSCERLWRELGGLTTFYRLRPEYLTRLDHITLRPGIWDLVSQLRNPCTVRELCDARPEPDIDIARWLCGLRHVRVVEKPRAEEILAQGEQARVAWSTPVSLPGSEEVGAADSGAPPSSGKGTAADLAPELFRIPGVGEPPGAAAHPETATPSEPPPAKSPLWRLPATPEAAGAPPPAESPVWESPTSLETAGSPPPAESSAPPDGASAPGDLGPAPIAPWPPEGAAPVAEPPEPSLSFDLPAIAEVAPAADVPPSAEAETSAPFELGPPPLAAAPAPELDWPAAPAVAPPAPDSPAPSGRTVPAEDQTTGDLPGDESSPAAAAAVPPDEQPTDSGRPAERTPTAPPPVARVWDPAATLKMDRPPALGDASGPSPSAVVEEAAPVAPATPEAPPLDWSAPAEAPAVAAPAEAAVDAAAPEITQKIPAHPEGVAAAPAPAAPAGASESGAPAELLTAVDRFNGRHRIVFEALRREIGAGVRNFVLTCVHRLGPAAASFEGLAPDKSGFFDREALARGLAERGAGDIARLEELIAFELNLVRDLMERSRFAAIEDALRSQS